MKKPKTFTKRDHCKYCGGTENLTVDHKHPVILGGSNEPHNLQTLCYPCNQLKSGIPHETFMKIMRHGIYCFLRKHDHYKI